MGAVVKVLSSVSVNGRTTGYVVPLEAALEPEVRTSPFSWRLALFGEYDILQVHWPEYLLRHPRPIVAWGKRQAYRLLLRRLRRRGTPVVRTLHNAKPHEPGDAKEVRLLEQIDVLTTEFVTLNAHTALPSGAPSTLVPHGHYRHLRSEDIPRIAGRILYFGIIKPYKGLEGLIDAFAGVPGEVGLRIVGRAAGQSRRIVDAAIISDPRVSAHLEYVDDDALSREITAADLVVLPIRDLHNSGSLFRALSLDRPVLVPRTPVTEDLAREVGAQWVLTYDAVLSAGIIADALMAASSVSGSPVLRGRDWSDVATAYRAVYASALARTRRSLV